KVRIVYIDSESLEEDGYHGELANVDGILVGPGFGSRGVEGKLRAIRYAREKKIPSFGICLGMQCARIDLARNVCGMFGAKSQARPTAPHPLFRSFIAAAREFKRLARTVPTTIPREAELV